MKTALVNATLFTGKEKLDNKALLVVDGTVHSIVENSEVPADFIKTDLTGLNIAPGLIDLQIYGSGGKLFGALPDVEGLKQMETDLLAQGTTGFLACSATNSAEVFEKVIDSAREYRKSAKGNFWGIHLEGPYLNPAKKGAHPDEFIRKGNIPEMRSWIERGAGEVKMMTIAPELQDPEFIDYLNSEKIIISAGHSNATYDEAMGFLNNPVQTCTHLFNAMPQIHHRDPGLIPAIFKLKPYASIIADGMHVAFPLIEIAKKQMGDKLFLITDAVTEAREGIYQHIFTGEKYVMPDGTLSGSSMTMLQSVANCVQKADIELDEALRMASTYPATLFGTTKKGYLTPGSDADIIVFTSDFKHHSTYLAGTLN
ncbi:MAG: N-acetylglucosamine-6-phosphate deacetylase [Daejeonella sp.]